MIEQGPNLPDFEVIRQQCIDGLRAFTGGYLGRIYSAVDAPDLMQRASRLADSPGLSEDVRIGVIAEIDPDVAGAPLNLRVVTHNERALEIAGRITAEQRVGGLEAAKLACAASFQIELFRSFEDMDHAPEGSTAELEAYIPPVGNALVRLSAPSQLVMIDERGIRETLLNMGIREEEIRFARNGIVTFTGHKANDIVGRLRSFMVDGLSDFIQRPEATDRQPE
jgi:hypothetical protein